MIAGQSIAVNGPDIRLDLLGVTVSLGIEHPAIREYVELMYGDYICASPASRHRFSVDGALRMFADGAPVGTAENIVNVEAVFDTTFLHWMGTLISPSVLLHAAALKNDQGCHVILGHSGAGKTTLGLGLASRGGDLLADDIVMVGPRSTVEGLGRPFHIRSSTGMALEGLLSLGNGKFKQAGKKQGATDLSSLMLIEDGLERPIPLPPRDLLVCLAKFVIAQPSGLSSSMATLTQIANSVPAFRLPRGRQPADALQHAFELIARLA